MDNGSPERGDIALIAYVADDYRVMYCLGANPANMHGVATRYGVRRLMPIECERLQGLPDNWTRWGKRTDGTVYEISDSARYRMCGNAVSTPVALWLGRNVQEVK